MAASRASELRSRRIELAEGDPPNSVTAEFAEHRARQAVQRAATAHQSAVSRHLETRQVHLRAAAAYEQAAVVLNSLDSDGHQSAAERHRDAAAVHEAILVALGSTIEPQASRQRFDHE